ncbi:MAG: hypothetical protein V1723_01180 [Candidatus Uhrbacteria bacterium]
MNAKRKMQNAKLLLRTFFLVLCSSFCGKRRGSTLLLAILILGGLVATATITGAIVIRGLRAAADIDRALIAAYAAESGVERFLYAVRQEGKISEEELKSSGVLAGELKNGARWEPTALRASVDDLVFSIPQDDVEQIDLFSLSGTFDDVGVNELRVSRVSAEERTEDAWLEVSWSPWLSADEWVPPPERRLIGPSELNEPNSLIVIPLHRSFVDRSFSIAPLRVRFRALHGDLPPLRVWGVRTDGTVAPLPTRLHVTVRGIMGNATSALAVELPPRAPLTPVFDFVLFSECDIVKGGTDTNMRMDANTRICE